MIAALFLLALAETARFDPRADAIARFHAEPAEVEIGQPIAWTLTVEHAAGAKVRLPEEDPALGDAWTIVEPRRVSRSRNPAQPDVEITRVEWTLLALEPGELTLAPWVVQCDGRDVQAEGAKIDVRAALAPGEDTPRAMRGHLPPPEGHGPPPGPWLVALLVVAAVAYVVLRKRRRRAVVTPSVRTPLEELAALRARAAADRAEGRESAREIVYAASRLLRQSADAAAGVSRAALTDAEWVRATANDERLPAGVRASSARVLSAAESVKYALHVPTPFALEETFRDVESALGALSPQINGKPPLKEVA